MRRDVTLIHRRGYIFGDPYRLRGIPRSRWIEVAHRIDLERLSASRRPIYYATPPEDLIRSGVSFVNEGLVYRAVPSGSPFPRRPVQRAALPRSSELLPGGAKRYDYVTRKLAVTYSDVRAQELWHEGRIAEALPWFEDAAQVGFDFPIAHMNLATAAAACGKPETALAELLEARSLSPTDPEPAARIGSLLATARLYRDAATWFERAYRLRPARALAADASRAWRLAGNDERARQWQYRAELTDGGVAEGGNPSLAAMVSR
jgi:tetratricopeptide (TPR) repeat protein